MLDFPYNACIETTALQMRLWQKVEARQTEPPLAIARFNSVKSNLYWNIIFQKVICNL